jgi:hypothetical protein
MCLAVESNSATPGAWQRLCGTKDPQLLPLSAGLTALKKENSRQERQRGPLEPGARGTSGFNSCERG